MSHARILRYKTCLYALVEDFMVAGGMWRKMIASRHQPEKTLEGEKDTLRERERGVADVWSSRTFGILHCRKYFGVVLWIQKVIDRSVA